MESPHLVQEGPRIFPDELAAALLERISDRAREAKPRSRSHDTQLQSRVLLRCPNRYPFGISAVIRSPSSPCREPLTGEVDPISLDTQ